MDIAEAELRRQLGGLLPEMRAFARFLARDRAVADDVVQDTVVRALGALHQFRPGTSLKAWTFTILRNAFYEQQRKRRRDARLIEASLAMGQGEAGVPGQEARSELEDLQQLIWTLPPLLREALILVGAQGLSHDEAAAVCGVPAGTMKARLSRARVALSTAMRAAEVAGGQVAKA